MSRVYYVINYFKVCSDYQVMCFVLDKNENIIKEINISADIRLNDLLILYDDKKEESMYIRIDKEYSVTEINVK